MSNNPVVTLNTTEGTIRLELFASEAPETVRNFLDYVKSGFYDGLIFHRVINGFMIQTGGFTPEMEQKAGGEPIRNEANNGVANTAGRVAMARTMDPHSASSQFFINVANNDFLNHRDESTQGWGYAAFGEVTEGMDVVDRIKQAKTGNRAGHQDVPTENIVITSATVDSDGNS